MISVVITTHGEGRDLQGILSSLYNQRQYRTGISTKGQPFDYEAGDYFSKSPFEVIVSSDGVFCGDVGWDYTEGEYQSFASGDALVSQVIVCPKADPPCSGHNTREPGIMAANGDWIALVNSDGYFFHGWFHSLVQELKPGVGLVWWDAVSNLWAWQARKCSLSWGEVDLACVCVRRDIAQDVGFEWRHYDADWDYIKACSEMCDLMKLRKVHINQVLTVHQ